LIAGARRQFEQIQTGSSTNVGIGVSSSKARAPDLQRYTLIRELHRGAQGVVYLAEQRSPRREVAVKMVREGPPGVESRFGCSWAKCCARS
jgi:hypothetical protein